MKIVYVLPSYFPETHGGTEVYTHELAKGMSERGCQVSVVVPRFEEEISDQHSYVFDSILVNPFFEKRLSIKARKLLDGKTPGLLNFIKLIKSLNPDIVHFQMLSGSGVISVNHLREVKKLGVKTILTTHLSHYTCLTETLLFRNKRSCDGKIRNLKCNACYLNRRLMFYPFSFFSILFFNTFSNVFNRNRKPVNSSLFSLGLHSTKIKKELKEIEENSDMVVSINEWYKRILIVNGISEEKIRVIKQGCITNESNFTNEKEFLPSNKVKFIFVGRISHLKGIHIFLKALKGINPALYMFDIFGKIDNPNDEYLLYCRKIIDRNGLSVRFNGLIQRKNIISTMNSYDILCLPSLFSEMSPLVIQEAFQAGIPVIGSNVPGITEHITHNVNGYIFHFGNYKELRNIIIKLTIKKDAIQTLKSNVGQPLTFNKVIEDNYALYSSLQNWTSCI